MGRPFTLTQPPSHCELDAVMSGTMTPNPSMHRPRYSGLRPPARAGDL
jgi:hypothetical protein